MHTPSIVRAVCCLGGGLSASCINYPLRIRYLPEDPPLDGYKTRGNRMVTLTREIFDGVLG